MFRVECDCGVSTGTVKTRELADELQEIHQGHCDGYSEVTPAPIPGHE